MPWTFLRRLTGAAMLDPATFEDVEADPAATSQAFAIVVLSSLAAGIGARGSTGAAATLAFFATASVIALVAWAGFALLIFEIGARILPGPATHTDPGELLRTLGFAATPGLIQIFGVFPGAAVPVFALAIIWTVAASVIGVRQALDYTSTGRAIAVCGLAALLCAVCMLVAGLLFGPTVSGA